MSVELVDAAFADVRADGLRWALGLPERSALATRTITGTDEELEIELRVLGASHQVLVRRGDAVLLSETVACDLTGGHDLPASTGAGDYRFTSEVRRLGAARLRARTDALVTALADHPAALLTRFPGTPYAVTALAVDRPSPAPGRRDRLAWRTWHAYPQTGELVATRSHVRTRPTQEENP